MKKIITAITILLLSSSLSKAEVSLRDDVKINDNNIMLSDIFHGINKDEDKKVSSAPKPLDSVTLDAGFISQVAKGYGVDYKIKTGYESIKISREGKLVGEDKIIAVLKSELSEKGINEDYDVNLVNFEPISVPLNANIEFEFSEFAYSDKTSTVVANVLLKDGENVIENRKITARFYEMVEIPVVKDAISLGKIINENDLVYDRIRASKVRANVALSADEVVGKYARKTLKSGQMIAISDLKLPELVKKGKQVRMILKRPNMTLSMVGKAMDSGAKDDVIRVLNVSSKAVIQAVVSDTNTVVVDEI